MLMPLLDAGINTLDDLLMCGVPLIVQWTGLPKTSVVKLCAYAHCWKALDCIKGRASPEPESDHSDGGDTDNYKEHADSSEECE